MKETKQCLSHTDCFLRAFKATYETKKRIYYNWHAYLFVITSGLLILEIKRIYEYSFFFSLGVQGFHLLFRRTTTAGLDRNLKVFLNFHHLTSTNASILVKKINYQERESDLTFGDHDKDY